MTIFLIGIICPPMWTIETTTQWEKDQKWYEKKRPDELAAVLRNLKRYLALLNCSKNSKCAEAGYLHKEPADVVAVDQRGGGGNLEETRLYTYASDQTHHLYLITIGNKQYQYSDIEYCKAFVHSLSVGR